MLQRTSAKPITILLSKGTDARYTEMNFPFSHLKNKSPNCIALFSESSSSDRETKRTNRSYTVCAVTG